MTTRAPVGAGSARSTAVFVARQAVKAVSAASDLAFRSKPGITILIYHRVGAGNGGQMDLPSAEFRDQLAWLSDTQRVLSLDQAIDELVGMPEPGGAIEPGVVLTFDDGTTDWVDNVLPALEQHSVPATFYVATSFVDEGTRFPGDGSPLSWRSLNELRSSDLVTIGSHTHRHLLLDRLDPATVADELDRSIDLLQSHLDVAVEHFAYPKAVAGSSAAEAAVRTRFRSAVLAGTRSNHPGADLHRLNRSPIQPTDGSVWFRRKARGGMRLEDDLRQFANRVRYRGLTS